MNILLTAESEVISHMKKSIFFYILFIVACASCVLGFAVWMVNANETGIRYYPFKTGYFYDADKTDEEIYPNDEIGKVADNGSPHEMYVTPNSQTTVTDDGEEITEYFEPKIGYINADGENVPVGYTNFDGEWIPLGYINADGDWIALGYKDADGKWILYEDNELEQMKDWEYQVKDGDYGFAMGSGTEEQREIFKTFNIDPKPENPLSIDTCDIPSTVDEDQSE